MALSALLFLRRRLNRPAAIKRNPATDIWRAEGSGVLTAWIVWVGFRKIWVVSANAYAYSEVKVPVSMLGADSDPVYI